MHEYTDYKAWKDAALAKGLKIYSDNVADVENGPDPSDAFEPTWAIETPEGKDRSYEFGIWSPEDDTGKLFDTHIEFLEWMHKDDTNPWDPYENDSVHGRDVNK
jgi:hypothetical protein